MFTVTGFLKRFPMATTAVSLLLCVGCDLQVQEKALHPVDDPAVEEGLDGEAPWLKAHLPVNTIVPQPPIRWACNDAVD